MDDLEVWKPVLGHEEYYDVSNFGNVKSKRSGKIIKPGITDRGYAQLSVSINGKRYTKNLNRVVAEAFFGKIDVHVDHIDGNKLNNNITNLRPCNARENLLYHYKSKYPGAVLNRNKKRWRSYIRIKNKNKWLGTFDTQKEASDRYLLEAKNITGRDIKGIKNDK